MLMVTKSDIESILKTTTKINISVLRVCLLVFQKNQTLIDLTSTQRITSAKVIFFSKLFFCCYGIVIFLMPDNDIFQVTQSLLVG